MSALRIIFVIEVVPISPVTLRQIAAISGVSYQTVSRVLNNQAHLHKPETVKRVKQVADELGYRPNLNARGVQTGHTRTIGVMNGIGWQDSYSMQLLIGAHDAIISQDYLPIMLAARPGLATELEQIHRLVDRRVDGVILRPVMHEVSDQYLREVVERKIPLVTVDIQVPESQHVDYVGTDGVAGGRKAAEHLVQLGHRRMVYLTWFGHLIMKKNRLKGFQEVVAQTPDAECKVYDIEFDKTNFGVNRALEILQSDDRPTAIFVSTDDLAKGVYAAAEKVGLRIPEDLSVVGFSDLDFALKMDPPLTTVKQDPEQIGQHAAKLVLKRVEGKLKNDNPEVVLFDPELIVRESTGPAI